MAKCCGDKPIKTDACDPCCPPVVDCGCASSATNGTPMEWFADMIDHCCDYAESAKESGKPVVGIMCEYAPRELIMAAGGVPVCLCGGSAKTIPAAEEHLPSNLCPLIKSTYGYHLLGTNPFLEMADLIVAETTCDGKKKMFELMGDSRPVYLMELTQKQDDPDAFEHWVKELHKLKAHMESAFGVEITNDKLNAAIDTMNRERALRRTLAEFMKSDNPPITGRQLLDLKSTISGIPADLEQYQRIIDHLSQLSDSNNGSRVRVLLTGVPTVHGAERVIDIIEDSGGIIVCMENCTGLKPVIEEVQANTSDPVRALAEKYFRLHCSVMTRNTRRMDYLRKLAEEYRAECIIDLVWQACITYDVESFHVRKLAEDELNLPYLRIETDYSPSDSSRIAVRVEALYETARSRCGSSCCK